MTEHSDIEQDSATATPRRRPPRWLPPHYLVAALILIAAQYWLPGPALWIGLPDLAWIALAGALAAMGISIALQGSRQFANAQTNIIPFTPASALVTDGVFRWSRNPMYLGMGLALLGAAVASDKALALLVPAGFCWLITARFIVHEETQMTETFPATYAAYCAQTRRWL